MHPKPGWHHWSKGMWIKIKCVSSLKNNFFHIQWLFRIKSIICLTDPAHWLITEGLATLRGEDYANRNQLLRKWANPILPRVLRLRGKGDANERAEF